MASISSKHILIITIAIAIFFTLSTARAPFKPNALFLATQRDNTTNLHVITLAKRTPRVPIPLVVDLNGKFLWVVCDQNYLSSTYNAPICHSTQCSSAGSHYCHKCSSSDKPRPGCHNNTCGVIITNPLTRKNAVSELAQDVVSIPASVNGHQLANISHFIFACAPSSLLQGKPIPPAGVQGIGGLGHTPVALPLQLSSRLGFQPQFSMCLGSPVNTNPNGGIFFGNVPSNIRPKALSYTPLTIGAQGEYFILIKEITINNKTVPFNTSLLSTTRGFSGTMITTTTPYTVLQHSIYETFARFFANELSGVPQVKAIQPFGLCFNSSLLPPTRVGAPNIDFVMHNRNVTWRVLGYDALVQVRPNVSCLAFVDGGSNTRAPITIGAFQLENNFLHFDLLRSRLGFNPSRLEQPIDCSKLNFSTVEMDGMGD